MAEDLFALKDEEETAAIAHSNKNEEKPDEERVTTTRHETSEVAKEINGEGVPVIEDDNLVIVSTDDVSVDVLQREVAPSAQEDLKVKESIAEEVALPAQNDLKLKESIAKDDVSLKGNTAKDAKFNALDDELTFMLKENSAKDKKFDALDDELASMLDDVVTENLVTKMTRSPAPLSSTTSGNSMTNIMHSH
eukprot:gnl/MRDRNA2_/MRDRNA2_54484_c0_seq1.p1 gnl/MRDRNA2_/MRDRNA2_54484_c0~~gnl/MRDRNA2_/MRDRNA2_54484_c0_seq1.p1  ORF type:complete len:215 (+),score=70.77 gnl/MRDRNA2_/MRDRNA2_54484_c0_seq1:67-645(+)